MAFRFENQDFVTDNDLNVTCLGRYPEVFIENDELRKVFEDEYNRSFLGADEIISLRQALVSKGMSFSALEAEIWEKVQADGLDSFRETLFEKMATGIGAGHSMGGLAGVVLGIQGSKMIDSGLTGLVASRSLVTSGRRRLVKEGDIVIPESLTGKKELLREYLEISRAAFGDSAKFKEKFKRLNGIEAFNKALPYNNPADLFIVLPLDTMATLHFEVMADKESEGGPFIPREIHDLVDRFPEITNENGMGTMYSQRVNVPRGTYLHYNVFKSPNNGNYALELAQRHGMPSDPMLMSSNLDLTPGLKKGLSDFQKLLEETRNITNPDQLAEAAVRCMLASRDITEEYNSAASALIIDQLSFRVWSEQKRHATLRQHVESIYSAAARAAEKMKGIWGQVEEAYTSGDSSRLPLDKLEEIMIVDRRLKAEPELLTAYVYHSGRQLMFFDKMVREGVPIRDAAYMIPRNTLTRNLEDYDFKNMVDLELPLRLCKTCEPERHMTSWQKRGLLAKAMPELSFLLRPKCGMGYCTERDFCNHIKPIRNYDEALHTNTKAAMLVRSKR